MWCRRISRASVSAAVVALMANVLLQPPQAQSIPGPRGTHTENGLAGYAKILCSGVFVSSRTPEDVARGSAYFFMPQTEQDSVKWTIDRRARLARASLGAITREARYYGDQGCIIQNPDAPGIHFTPVAVRTRLPDAATEPWPMGDRAERDSAAPVGGSREARAIGRRRLCRSGGDDRSLPGRAQRTHRR